jgi:SAM-dependent methyltransferase
VSPSSIAHTRQVLEILGESHLVDLHARDLYAREAYAGEEGTYDTIVFSEVLEHLEQPLEALQIIRSLLSPEGTVWINVPANGPSTDHLFLLRSPQEVRELAAVAGLEVIREEAFPIAGYSLERAIRQGLPITCILTARSAR